MKITKISSNTMKIDNTDKGICLIQHYSTLLNKKLRISSLNESYIILNYNIDNLSPKYLWLLKAIKTIHKNITLGFRVNNNNTNKNQSYDNNQLSISLYKSPTVTSMRFYAEISAINQTKNNNRQ